MSSCTFSRWALLISLSNLLKYKRRFSNIIDLNKGHSAVNALVSMSASCALTLPSNLFIFHVPQCLLKFCSSLPLYWIKSSFISGSLQGSKMSKSSRILVAQMQRLTALWMLTENSWRHQWHNVPIQNFYQHIKALHLEGDLTFAVALYRPYHQNFPP